MKAETKWNWKKIVGLPAILLVGQVVICGLISLLITGEMLQEDMAPMIVRVISAGLVYVCCWLSGRKSGNRMQTALVIAAIYLLLCLFVKALAFPAIKVGFSAWMTLPFASAVLGAMTATVKKDRRR